MANTPPLTIDTNKKSALYIEGAIKKYDKNYGIISVHGMNLKVPRKLWGDSNLITGNQYRVWLTNEQYLKIIDDSESELKR